jgi:hypothetical protein
MSVSAATHHDSYMTLPVATTWRPVALPPDTHRRCTENSSVSLLDESDDDTVCDVHVENMAKSPRTREEKKRIPGLLISLVPKGPRRPKPLPRRMRTTLGAEGSWGFLGRLGPKTWVQRRSTPTVILTGLAGTKDIR